MPIRVDYFLVAALGLSPAAIAGCSGTSGDSTTNTDPTTTSTTDTTAEPTTGTTTGTTTETTTDTTDTTAEPTTGTTAEPTTDTTAEPTTGTTDVTTGGPSIPPEDIPGVWTGAWGTMVLKKVGGEVWGAYSHEEGTVVGTYTDGLFVGWWCEPPSRMPDADAGDVEFKFVDGGDVISLDGRWKYGSAGEWDENWDLVKSDDPPPADLEARFADVSAFCPKP